MYKLQPHYQSIHLNLLLQANYFGYNLKRVNHFLVIKILLKRPILAA